jgi:UDP-N-acetyl-D-glucosamine dehydrogenase
MSKIAVIGLGYVGLPLALLADKQGFEVLGLDSSSSKIDLLKSNKSPIDGADIPTRLTNSKIKFTSKYPDIKNVNIAIVCVPTPVSENKVPDLSIVISAAVKTAASLKDGALLVIESTINPGVCDEVLIPEIEANTRHKIGKTLHIAHCPERINPGDAKWHVGNINRVLGANSNEALEIAYEFYDKLVDAKIKKMDNIKEAEACKVVENSFRDVNIAFVNELAMSFQKLGINVVNVIDGAATKPFAFMAHYPGIGVGGHCIPVDPYYLIEYARNNGFEHHFLSLARSINENMPAYSVDKMEEALIENSYGKLENKVIAILGLSYKQNVGDDRESPAYAVIAELEKRGANVKTYDPYIESSSTSSLNEVLEGVDAAILVTAHDEFKLDGILNSKIKIFLDGRNKFINLQHKFSDKKIQYLRV